VAAQNAVDPDREDPESEDEDYAMGTTNRIKVKGQPLLAAEVIYDKFVSTKKALEGMNIIKEKKAEIRKKKIVIVNKEEEKKNSSDAEDEELLDQENSQKIEKIKGLKRRGEKLTAEEKKARKEVLKEIKNERKQKKREFKGKFDDKVKGTDQKLNAHNKHDNLQGVSYVKMS